jgi:hypothetical protein
LTLHVSADTNVMTGAHARGFTLMQRELDTGQVAWMWKPANGGPQPPLEPELSEALPLAARAHQIRRCDSPVLVPRGAGRLLALAAGAAPDGHR